MFIHGHSHIPFWSVRILMSQYIFSYHEQWVKRMRFCNSKDTQSVSIVTLDSKFSRLKQIKVDKQKVSNL